MDQKYTLIQETALQKLQEWLENFNQEELEELPEEVKSEEAYDAFLKDVDRDQYYWAKNLMEEFEDLDEGILEDWKNDLMSLEGHYRFFAIRNILKDHPPVKDTPETVED